jgi:hypothetical protein
VHFDGKEAVEHVIEKQVEGLLSSTEVHGAEAPGHISAGSDAARETAVVFILLAILFNIFDPNEARSFLLISSVFGLGWVTWKVGRSAWLGWARLERLHRVMAEEKWEIEHHRQQERTELKALYEAKGLEGKLLEDVLDVLMADEDRILRVMLEEELGLSLENQEHPLKQSLGAAAGTLIAWAICWLGLFLYPPYGVIFGGLLVIAISAILSAQYEKNRLIPAVVWNLGIAILTFGVAYFVDQFIKGLS